MKNTWRTADNLIDKYDKRDKSFDDIEDFDDFAIEILAEKPLDELLSEHGLTREQALSEEEAERRYYNELANKLEIKSREFPWIWIELIDKCESDLYEDKIKLLLWLTAGGSFTDGTDDELTAKENKDLLIRRHFGVKERVTELERHFESLREYIPKFAEILAKIDSIKKVKSGSTNKTDVDQVFSVICDNGFDAKCGNTEVLHDNLLVVSLIIETHDFLKTIKPLIYFQVYVRQRNKLLNEDGFIPNLKSIFKYREYGIFDNNEKNFNQYAECCRLYILLKGCFSDADEKLCDTGFLYCSNLADWYHEIGYMDYRSEIPDGIPFTTYALIREMSVLCFDKSIYEDNIEKLEKWRRQYRKLYIEAVNAVEDIRFKELGEFAELGEGYCQQFFNEDIKKCVKNEDQHKAAWGLLVYVTEKSFDELLALEICGIFDKYYFNI